MPHSEKQNKKKLSFVKFLSGNGYANHPSGKRHKLKNVCLLNVVTLIAMCLFTIRSPVEIKTITE